MKNNLFRFATSELSQDAFICWCLNWFNDESNPKLRDMAIELVKRMAGNIEVRSVDILRQYSNKVTMEYGKEIPVKIDVLAIINGEIALVIEDKTFTTVHHDQIFRYTDGLKAIIARDKNGNIYDSEGKGHSFDPDKIRTVFWKTGFHYDFDQATSADVKLNGQDMLDILSPYQKESHILDDYLENLKELLGWYEKNGDFTIPHILDSGEQCYDWYCNVSKEQYPQYRLMRTVFPADRWIIKADCRYELYQVYHGSSFGRPWTEMGIFQGTYPGSTDKYELFWRIDTDKDGPYISLRLYEGGLNKENKSRHVEKYEACIQTMRSVIDAGGLPLSLAWDEVDPGYRGNYKEASIFHICLADYLKDWGEKGEKLVLTIREINDRFLEKR